MDGKDRIFENLEKKYSERLESVLGSRSLGLESSEFRAFVQEERQLLQVKTWYERFCRASSQVLPFIRPGKGAEARLNETLMVAGLNVSPGSVWAAPVFFFFLCISVSLVLALLGLVNFAFFAVASGLIISIILFRYPDYSAQITRIKSQQESILAILYMTIYIRFNPVFERAIRFAAEHLDGPLGKDLKQIIWMIGSEKKVKTEDAVSYFVPLWSKRNDDFLKAIMILYQINEQPDEANRNRVLNKALDTILQDTHQKMKHYSYDLKMPTILLETFGVMLPLLGLVAFPMVSVFMTDSINIMYVFFGYVIILPAVIFFLSQRIIAKRPGAFSVPEIEQSPFLPPKGKIKVDLFGRRHYVSVLPVALVVALLVMAPGVYHLFSYTIPLYNAIKSKQANVSFTNMPPQLEAEYSVKALLLVATVPVGIALGLIIYFYFMSRDRLRLRMEIEAIEEESNEAVFSLMNQFTENIPMEVAIKKVLAEYQMLNAQDKRMYSFFQVLNSRMQFEGINFESALFGKPYGVLLRYPSVLMTEIFWVINETAKKGSRILYYVGTKISTYLANVKKIKELIYSLLNETVSSINLQARFLAPFIAGIVGSITVIIIKALADMGKMLAALMGKLSIGFGDKTVNIFDQIFDFSSIIPPTMFQVLIGIYVIETTVLLSILSSGVEDGFDSTKRSYAIARNLMYSIAIYFVVTIMGVVMLSGIIQKGVSSVGA
ncbi:hypothetical protein HY640_04700 [Candidatus Woesearchaeota archaeon]|nr:hypothetical protein [Candidatus Woesearchaeota archaeon]